MDESSVMASGAAADFEDAIRRFEVAWQGPSRPEIGAYVTPGAPGYGRLLVELIHVDLEYRLRTGEAARVEDYLAKFPALGEDRETMLGLVAAEYEWRRRRESELAIADFVRRFPDFGRELPDRIAAATVACGARRDTRPDKPPPAVDGYQILGALGHGGMGVVYAARQLRLDRLVALKFLPEESALDPLWLERFRREALTASALNHPNICTIFDTGDSGGRPYIVMEMIEGKTLAEVMVCRPAVDESARLIRQAARALSAAHTAGVVHRDVKPQNLMVRADGIVKVLDFGLARRLPNAGTADSALETDAGTRVGTVMYMSPEQARGEPVGTASDVFSLGVVVYELAAGRHPFPGILEVDIQSITNPAPLAITRLNPECPAALDGLVRQMMAPDSRLRPTAAEVDAALAEIFEHGTGGPGARPAATARSVTVGREAELTALRSGFESAAAGSGLVLCVTGEPGLGKTTLVERFIAELAAGKQAHDLARGRCSERLAGTEAYLPFLEALDNLLQGPGGPTAARLMKALAPTWYAQLAPAAADSVSQQSPPEVKEASQERWKRELGAFFLELSRRQPLVLFLDDVHWADPSSIDLLAYLGGRCSEWRVLLVLTYRPSELALDRHPFGPIKLDLQGRGVCREIALPFLSRDDVDRYLGLAFAGHQFPNDLTATLHDRTEGSPLFMVDLLRYLCDRGVIVRDDGRWTLARAVPDFQRDLPESVRGMVQRKIDQLTAADRHLLSAASVQGPEFDSAVVAEVLGRDAADVEERLDALDRVHFMVHRVREQTFPDRTLTVRYGFVHVLYQNALYVTLQPSRKAAWSAAAARALQKHYGEKTPALAAELAMLFEAARDPERAADHYLTAAGNAVRVFAHHEAVALARRGLAQLETLPDTTDRARRELPLQMTLGIQLQVVQGYAAPAAERTYDRARLLCERLDDGPSLFLVLWGLWMVYEVRSDLQRSRDLAERLLILGRQARSPAFQIQGHMALAVTSFSLGEWAATRDNAEQAVALYDPALHSGHTHLYGQDPKSASLAFGAVSLWLLGYPDRAKRCSREAVAVGDKLGHPTTRALALYFAAMLRQYCRDPVEVRDNADATTAVAAEHGLSLWLANGLVMGGWAAAEQGDSDRGIAMLRQGIADWAATGAETHRTYFFGLLAEALGRGGQTDVALGVLSEAVRLMGRTGTVFHGAELYRLQGEFLLRRRDDEPACREAEEYFRQALAVARRQQARSLELRAAMSLTRLCHRQGRQAEARPILAECYDRFTEGFDTSDLIDAKELLERAV